MVYLYSNLSIKIFNSTYEKEDIKKFIKKNGFIKIEKNCEYYILFLSDNSQYQKRTTINFYFYFSNEKEIFILDEKNTLKTYPIIVEQKLYFLINIENLKKEDSQNILIEKKNGLDIKYKIKYYDNNNIDEMNDENSILLNENCDKLKCNFLISKLNDNDKSILFIVDIINLNGIKFTLFNITLMDGNEGNKNYENNENYGSDENMLNISLSNIKFLNLKVLNYIILVLLF